MIEDRKQFFRLCFNFFYGAVLPNFPKLTEKVSRDRLVFEKNKYNQQCFQQQYFFFQCTPLQNSKKTEKGLIIRKWIFVYA